MAEPQQPEPLHPERLTWAVLLSHWVEFARSAVALPTGGEGGLLRDSVPDVIMLQAVWFALEHVRELPHDERALGLDRAQVLIDKHTDALRKRWADRPLPAGIVELIDDAQRQLEAVQAEAPGS